MTEPQHITAYREGRFTAEPAPEWWCAEWDQIWPDKGDGPRANYVYGEEHGPYMEAWRLAKRSGLLVDVRDGDEGIQVWMPTDADWLDFLTTRAPTYIGLSADRPITASLDRLCNILTAYARHGQGDHIDRIDGKSEIDARRDRTDFLRRKAEREAKK